MQCNALYCSKYHERHLPLGIFGVGLGLGRGLGRGLRRPERRNKVKEM